VERVIKPVFKQAFSLFPSLERILVTMLKRGGPDSRNWVYMATGRCPTPELEVAILDFITGQSGTDKCRSDFLMLCSQLKWLPSNTTQLWRKGKQCPIRTTNMEIYWETERMNPPLSSAGAQKAAEAHEAATEDGDYERAIELLMEVDAAEPGRDSIRYNIAAFHLILGHQEIYDEMIEQVIQDFPDYLFAQMAQAQRLIKEGQLDDAWDLLVPLYESTRLHVSEYRAFSIAQAMYHLAKGEVEIAQTILQNGASVCGEDFPTLQYLQRELTR
jgi:tetratricopeptide (TPR) repeat protein